MNHDILPIGMKEMNQIFDVVDELEISRESIQVELLPDGEGAIEKLDNGKVRIVLPETTELSGWLSKLEDTLRELGLDAAGEES